LRATASTWRPVFDPREGQARAKAGVAAVLGPRGVSIWSLGILFATIGALYSAVLIGPHQILPVAERSERSLWAALGNSFGGNFEMPAIGGATDVHRHGAPLLAGDMSRPAVWVEALGAYKRAVTPAAWTNTVDWLNRIQPGAGSPRDSINAPAQPDRFGGLVEEATGAVSEGSQQWFDPDAVGLPHVLVENALGLGVAGVLSGHVLNYDLAQVSAGDEAVPRLLLASLPAELQLIDTPAVRKSLFIKAILPVVLRVNEMIMADRARLTRLIGEIERGQRLGRNDQSWLNSLYTLYEVEPGDLASLLAHIDLVPPSLAIAQAAEESGWGTSRFAREGNALFGQYTTDDTELGIVPDARDEDRTHRVRAYESLFDTVRSYALNLNTHAAYRDFRVERSRLRRGGAEPDGFALAGGLVKYSARGDAYVKTIRHIMRANDLETLDSARLDGTRWTRNDSDAKHARASQS
jgi:Bax protein